MRTIVAGSRSISNYEIVKAAIEGSGFNITTLISGTARGVDQLGERWAIENGISVEKHPADWNKWGSYAGPKRNKEMAEVAEACIIVWDKESKGTKNMMINALNNNLKLFVYDI
jgi:hypothetical protein